MPKVDLSENYAAKLAVSRPSSPMLQEEPPRFLVSQEQELQKAIDEAHTAISRLENRLDIVRGPNSADCAQMGEEPGQICSPLTDRLRWRTREVYSLIGRIEALIDTVEV